MTPYVQSPELFDVEYVDVPDEDAREIDVTLAMMRQVQDMLMILRNKSAMNYDTVASLEAINPDFCLYNDLFQGVSIYSPEAYSIAMEYLTIEDIKVISGVVKKAGGIVGDTSKFIFHNTTRAYALIKEHRPVSGFIKSAISITETAIDAAAIATIALKTLDPREQKKLIAVTAGFTGLPIKTEADVNTVLVAVGKSKNASELMSNLYMPKYSGLVLNLYQVNSGIQKALVKYTQQLDEIIAPGIDTNFNMLMNSLMDITASRDWAALAQLDQPLYEVKYKLAIMDVAKPLNVPYNKKVKHKKFIGQTYKAIKPLLEPAKMAKDDNPTFTQPLDKSFKELAQMVTSVTGAVTTLAELSNKNGSRAVKIGTELREFRMSKTFKESVTNSGSINKFSNENYGNYLKELRELAHFVSFLTKLNEDLVTAYVKTFSILAKLNDDTEKYIAYVTKLKGE